MQHSYVKHCECHLSIVTHSIALHISSYQTAGKIFSSKMNLVQAKVKIIIIK